MIDWVRPTQHKTWLGCEKDMYRQLIGEPFPASGQPSAEAILRFDRLAIARAWRYLSWVVQATRRVVIWTNHPFVKEEYPLWTGHPLLQQVDWVLNESPDLSTLEWLRNQIGPQTLIVQNLCGWKDHDANAWEKIDTSRMGLYGFAKADAKTTLPAAEPAANARNIEVLREAYHAI